MTQDDLLKPVTDDAPCGPDLHASEDPEFDEYYFGALGRLPSYYHKPGVERPDGSLSPDQIFDSGSVDITAESKAIHALLNRSKDIRLLVLLAQWEALAGRLEPLTQTIEDIATLLAKFPDALHPTLEHGAADRREALAELANQTTIIQPMHFRGLTGTDEVSLRKIKVAAGSLTPLQNEQDLTAGILNDALSDPANKKEISTNHAALLRLSEALSQISRTCLALEAHPFSPAFDGLAKTVEEMLTALSAASPELRAAEKEAAMAHESADAVSENPANTGDTPTRMADTPASAPVKSQSEARLALEACEHYYRKEEPSSAALLLVAQARLLIGRPLVEALETLLPEKATQTVVDFGPKIGFSLNIDRLRQLTESAPQSAAPQDAVAEEASTPPVVRSSAEAAGVMRAVEEYFLRAERSSPVPILLQRARSYLERDFQSLVDELVPDVETN
ncbi:MAG: ImpA family type VI secretion system protein [Sulfitobacter sp.]